MLDGALVLADELVEAGDVDVIRVGSGQVETAQQRDGRLPGDRLVVDSVLGEEVPSFSSQCIGEFRGLEGREVSGLLSELRFGDVLVADEGFGGEAADALEEQASDDLFAGCRRTDLSGRSGTRERPRLLGRRMAGVGR